MGHGIDALYRLNVTLVLSTVNCLQSFWFRSKPTTPAASLQIECDTIVQQWRTYIWPKYQAFMTADVQWVAQVCTCLTPPSLAQTYEVESLKFGVAAGEALPPHDAAVLSLYTAYPGRRTHGRLYIPGVPEGQTAAGVLNSAWQSKLDDIGFALTSQFGETGTSSYVWGGVFSRKNGAVRLPGPPPYIQYSPLAHLPWKRYVINARIKTQRHRLLGRGI